MPALPPAGRGCRGPEDQHEREGHEHRELGPAGQPERCREVLDEADHEAAEHRAGDVADAAEDGRRERLQAGVEAEVLADEAEVVAPHDARRAGQRATDGERERDGLVDVDTHELRRLLVERRRAHGPAQAGPPDERLEDEHQREGDEQDDEVEHGDRCAEHVDPPREREDLRRVAVTAAEHDQGDVLEDERHAHRGDQRREA